MAKYANPPNQSKGILDDFSVRKSIETKRGTILKTPANDDDIVNKKYVDDEIDDKIEDGTSAGQMAFWNGTKWVKTETSELVWDDVNKRFGVGTATPSAKFEVSDSDNTILAIHQTDAPALSKYAQFVLVQGSTLFGANDKSWQFFSSGTNVGEADFVIQYWDGTSFSEKMRILANGNVGFGGTPTGSDFKLTGDGTGSGFIINYNDGGNNYLDTRADMHFRTSGSYTDRMIIKADGKIGIGTASPGSLLTLSGTSGLTMEGDSRVEKVHWIGANGIKAPGAKPATFVEDGLTGCWEFADAIEANQESISGTVKIPNDMDRSVVPKFGIGWHANGVSPGDCEWQFEYLWIAPNEDVTAAAQETLTATSTASATSDGLVVAEITGIDLPSGTDTAMFWRVTRLSAHANDTIAAVTHLRGNYFKYTANKLGEAL